MPGIVTIRHGFLDWPLDIGTETLIVGTFNPGPRWVDADFFYSSSRNHLWTILATAFGLNSLKSKADKIAFCEATHIGFIDLIEEVEVEQGHETDMSDIYLDRRAKWRPLARNLDSLLNLKRVCLSRKTFSGIPNIKNRAEILSEYLRNRSLELRPLISPARYYNAKKQAEWNEFLKS